MRKADNTIVFGSQTPAKPLGPPPRRDRTQVMASRPMPSFPEPVTRSAHPTPAFFTEAPSTTATPMRPLSEDLVDERSYMSRPERGLAFAAVSLALVGVAAAGTYFFLGSRESVSTTTTTSAELAPTATTIAAPVPNPTPTPATEIPTTTPSELPEHFDAVRAPGLTKPQLPKEIPGPQLAPTERPQASNQAPAATFPATTQTANKVPMKTPPPGMSDEALERAGYYGNITPIMPTAPSTASSNAMEPRAPSAASTEEPKQFTPQPPPSEVMPDMQIKE